MPIVLLLFLRECGPVRPVQLVVFSPRVEFNFVENLEFHMGRRVPGTRKRGNTLPSEWHPLKAPKGRDASAAGTRRTRPRCGVTAPAVALSIALGRQPSP